MLTEKLIRDAKPRTTRYILWDSIVKGFGVRIYPSGRASYIISYRTHGGGRLAPKHTAKIASWPDITLREARRIAGRELTAIRFGQPDILQRRQTQRQTPTMAHGTKRYFDEYLPKRLAAGLISKQTIRIYHQYANRCIKPSLTSMRVTDVRNTDIEKALHQIPPITRNRMLSFLNNLFNLFETWNLRLPHSNPCRGLHYARETPRDRTLTRNEFHRLGIAYRYFDKTHPVHVAALRIATLSGLRISEVLAIHWNDIDFGSGRLILPDTKTGRRQHDLPLPAIDILHTLRKLHSKPYVFPSTRGQMTYTPLCRFFHKCTKHAQLHDVRIHDLRRSVMTLAASTNLNSHVVRDLLGHRNARTADRYIREVGGPVRDARRAIGIDINNMISENPDSPPLDPPGPHTDEPHIS